MFFDEVITEDDKNRAITELNLNSPNFELVDRQVILLIIHYKFDLEKIPKLEIIKLLEEEVERCTISYRNGSFEDSEYIRTLCGYLFCIGDISDVPIIEKAKCINMDFGCSIDGEWIESLKNGGIKEGYTRSRDEIVEGIISYMKYNFGLENL